MLKYPGFWSAQTVLICAQTALLAATAGILSGCTRCRPENTVLLAATTTTDNSGLLDVLLPAFTDSTGIRVRAIISGTGQAIRNAQNGDADVLLIHLPSSEEQFLASGYGTKRIAVMYNDFILAGPPSDPAGIHQASNAAQALKAIAMAAGTQTSDIKFISRADQSGTHAKEMQLWESVGIQPGGRWYLQAGQGMGAVLTMAGEMHAYTLCDRATFIVYSSEIQLKILYQQPGEMVNLYSIIPLSRKQFPNANHRAAQMLVDFITSLQGQQIISGYKVGGQQLYHPGQPQINPEVNQP